MLKVAITTSSFAKYDDSPLVLCKDQGVDVTINPYKRKVKPEELIQLAGDAVGLVAGTEPLNAEVLSKLKFLKVISRCGVGLDNVDLAAAQKLGIRVFNTPDGPTVAVAELTVGLILNLLRKTYRMDPLLKSGKWDKLMGNLLYQKKVGLVGMGRIGRKVAELLKSFGCYLFYSDPFLKDKIAGLDNLLIKELLNWADIISLHVSTSKQLLGEEEFKFMKKGAWLINLSRGGVVNEGALFTYIKRGDLSGAAIDVFEQEPYKGPLATLDNVILTPHIGSYAREARVRMEIEAVKNLLNGLKDSSQDKK